MKNINKLLTKVLFISLFCLSCTTAKTESETSLGTYISSLQQTIKSNWSEFEANKGKKAQVEFGILSDGKIVDIHILSGSGDNSFDNSVVTAIEKSSPFSPPPVKYFESLKKVRIVFDDAKRS